jgi:beta-N-acetylhexosaminidase
MVHLSTSACAGQVIVAGFAAGEPPQALQALARQGELGGFILFRRNIGSPAEVVGLTARLASLAPSDLPLWIAVDQEGGRVARLGPPVLTLPPMRVLGQIDDLSLTQDAALTLGRQLALLGFNIDFAPVLDVDSNPANPVIGDRSFGPDPLFVIDHARAFAAGLMQAGIVACGKHFPGHGDTELDSHLALPRLTHDRLRLDEVELAPFVALCSELPAIMTAHVVFEAIDAECPATLSRKVIDGVLRVELGYAGLVFTDDLEMKAIADGYGVAAAACSAIEAGCDHVLICSNPELVLAAHAALLQKAEHDAAFAARLRAAAERSLAVRMRHAPRPAGAHEIEARLRAQPVPVIEERIRTAREGMAK